MKYLGIGLVWLITLVAIAQVAIRDTKEVMEHEMEERLREQSAEKCPEVEPKPDAVELRSGLQACLHGLEACAEDLHELVVYAGMCDCRIEQASWESSEWAGN